MRVIKVLIVSDYAYPAGGIEVFIDEIVNATNTIIMYRILTWHPSEDTKPRRELAPTHRVNCGDIAGAWAELDWADLIFFQSSWNIRLLGALVRDYCKETKKHLVTVVHTTSNSNTDLCSDKYQRTLFSEIVKISSVVVCVSYDVLSSLRSLNIDLEKERTKYQVIENATRFNFAITRVKGRRVVSFVGRPTHAKGIDIFLNAVSRLADTDLMFKLNTVSLPPPDEARSLRNIIEVSYLLSNDEMIDFYESTDLLIVPYRNSDGLPLTILEALSCGVPIVGFDSLGVSSILNRYKQMVLKSQCPSELVKMIKSWSDGKISIAAPVPHTIPTWEQQAKKYIELFKDVLGD